MSTCAPLGKPRAAMAAGASTTRSIHISRRDSATSGSGTSQVTGSSGPTKARTRSTIVPCEARIDHNARVVGAERATSTNDQDLVLGPAHR